MLLFNANIDARQDVKQTDGDYIDGDIELYSIHMCTESYYLYIFLEKKYPAYILYYSNYSNNIINY